MKLSKEEFLFFLKNRRFTVPAIITLLISYTFTLTHPSIGIDDLSMDRYLYGELFAQGRMTGTILQQTLGLTSFAPFALDFLAVVCLLFASIMFCILFRRITNDHLNFYSYVFFSCLLLSYPLICEIFVYMGAGLIVTFGYLFVAFALLFVYNWISEQKIRYLFFAAACLIVVTSGYESLDIVYIGGIFSIFILRFLYTNNDKYKKLGRNLIDGFKALIPLVLGVVLEFIISKAVILFMHLKVSSNGQNAITYFKAESPFLFIKKASIEIIYRYVLKAIAYFPITVLNIAVIIAVLMMIFYGIKRKSITIVLLFLGTLFSLILLTIIQGSVTPYRACQIFGFFVAFILMLASQIVQQGNLKRALKMGFGILACLLVFYQASDLNKWFYIDYLRFQDDVNTVNSIATQLDEKYDVKHKAVIFTGRYKVSSEINKYTQIPSGSKRYRLLQKWIHVIYASDKKELHDHKVITITDVIGKSYIPWSKLAFHEVNTELLKLFAYEGYDYKQGTQTMYIQALKSARTMSSWPRQGSIADMGDYILVNFGNEKFGDLDSMNFKLFMLTN